MPEREVSSSGCLSVHTLAISSRFASKNKISELQSSHFYKHLLSLSLYDFTLKRVYETSSELEDFLPHSENFLKYAFMFILSCFGHYTLGN